MLDDAGSLCFFANSLARAPNHLRRAPLDQAPGGCPALIGPKGRDNPTAAAESSQEESWSLGSTAATCVPSQFITTAGRL